MAARTVNDGGRHCKTCAAYDRVNDRHEYCTANGYLILAEDPACPRYANVAPWFSWILTGTAGARITSVRENDQ